MKSKTPKHLIQAHRLICGHDKLRKKSHSKAEYRHLNDVRRIFEDRNIVGLGIAEKVTEKKRTGELCLRFYVTKKIPKSRAKCNVLVPSVISIGGRFPVFTDVHETGVIRAQLNVKSSPIQSGFSVSHIGAQGPGTVGAIVKNGSTHYILSNSHVLALSGRAKRGDSIIYPGRFDGAVQKVAELVDFVKLDRQGDFFADAAIAEIIAAFDSRIDFGIPEAGGAINTIDPTRDMKIFMRGASTDRATSVVIDVHCNISIVVPGVGKVSFVDQVCCERYSEEGDSGAIIIDRSSGRIVGLHVGGSDKDSYFSPIMSAINSLTPRCQFVDF
jgi:hypothetical protein